MVFLIAPIYCNAQTIHGKILDSGSQSPIGYVNIGIIGKDVGTVSNEQGNFTITLDSQYNRDTLKFSMIGFQSLKYEVGV